MLEFPNRCKFHPKLGNSAKTVLHFYRPQRSCEGYVFTRVCHSVHRMGGVVSQHALQVVSQHALQQGGVLSQHALQLGGACSGGLLLGGLLWRVPAPGGCLLRGGLLPGGCGDPPKSRRLLFRTVRILLECILVCKFASDPRQAGLFTLSQLAEILKTHLR